MMPADLFRRVDLDLLYPPFLELVLQLAANCREKGKDYWATSGFRSSAEQDALFRQGRDGRGGPRVTDAIGGDSPHQYGIAVDFALDADTKREGLQPDWRDEEYELLGQEARALGLTWGGDFRKPDRPHVQLSDYVTLGQLQPLKRIFTESPGSLSEKLVDVWAEVNGQGKERSA